MDWTRPENRIAFAREYARRYGRPVHPTTDTSARPVACAGFLPGGRPDINDPITARLEAGLAETLALPAGPSRQRLEDQVFRESVGARYWPVWTQLLAPGFVSSEFADAHYLMWDWWRKVDRGQPPPPLAAAMFRGGAKSATAVLMTVGVALGRLRDYALYVHAVKEKAQDEVGAMSELLQSDRVARTFPDTAAAYVTRSGQQRDNRIERFRNQAGFTIDAFGMDQALRGRRMDEDRPGWIILDDLEDHRDSPYITRKKQTTVTSTIIPAGSPDVAIVFVQNLIHPRSMMSAVAGGSLELLANRVMVGPVEAIRGLTYAERSDAELDQLEVAGEDRRRWKVTGGIPAWGRYGLDVAERELNLMGAAAFEREKQHNFDIVEGDLFHPDHWQYVASSEVPTLTVMARAWDLAASEDESADFTAGTIGGLSEAGDLYILDVYRNQLSIADVEEKVVALHDQARETWRREIPTLIERQIGTAQKHYELRWEPLLGRRVWHYVDPVGSKPERAEGLAAKQQRHRVFLVVGAWNATFVREHGLFPEYCDNDDQVDSAVHLHNWLVTESAKRRKRRGSVSTRAGRA